MRIPSQMFGYWNQVRPQAAQMFSTLDIPGELRPHAGFCSCSSAQGRASPGVQNISRGKPTTF
jgi:hypothetical protein